MTLPPGSAGFALQAARPSDFESLLALRLRAMRDSLERIGRYDEQRARERLAETFDPAFTHHILVDSQRVGFIVLKTLSHAMRLNHFYIDPSRQARGIGHQVMLWICAEADRQQLPIELMALSTAAPTASTCAMVLPPWVKVNGTSTTCASPCGPACARCETCGEPSRHATGQRHAA